MAAVAFALGAAGRSGKVAESRAIHSLNAKCTQSTLLIRDMGHDQVGIPRLEAGGGFAEDKI